MVHNFIRNFIRSDFVFSIRDRRTLRYQEIRRRSFTRNDANKLLNYTTATA